MRELKPFMSSSLDESRYHESRCYSFLCAHQVLSSRTNRTMPWLRRRDDVSYRIFSISAKIKGWVQAEVIRHGKVERHFFALLFTFVSRSSYKWLLAFDMIEETSAHFLGKSSFVPSIMAKEDTRLYRWRVLHQITDLKTDERIQINVDSTVTDQIEDRCIAQANLPSATNPNLLRKQIALLCSRIGNLPFLTGRTMNNERFVVAPHGIETDDENVFIVKNVDGCFLDQRRIILVPICQDG